MREGGSGSSSSGAAASAPLTVPLVDAGVGAAEIGAEYASAWGYVLGFQGKGATPAAQVKPAAAAKPAKTAKPGGGGGLELSIEKAGRAAVLVAIRAK